MNNAERKDITGRTVRVGDKVVGFGHLTCQDGFKIDRTPEVTVRMEGGVMFFGALSASSFTIFKITTTDEQR